MDRFLGSIDLVGNMPRDGLSLTVRVSSYQNIIGLTGKLFQLADNLFLAGNNFIAGFVIIVEIQSDLLFGKVFNMADRGEHQVI